MPIPRVVEAVRETAGDGTTFGAPTEIEVELARAVVAAVPSVEQVRFVSSGTEAAMSALRLARAFTGRDRILKFAGGYHGHADALLAQAGSGLATLGIPSSPGVPDAVVADTLVAEYNDLEAVRRSPSTTATSSRPSSSSRWPATWASSRPSRGSSRASAPSATAPARFSSPTR